MTNIVAFAGKIGAGKSTLRNFLFGYMMKHYVPSTLNDVDGMIDTYQINSLGQLFIPGEFDDGVVEMGQFDPVSRDPEVRAFLRQHVWEYVRAYSFAGKLKVLAHELFGFPEESIYGTQEQKVAPTDRLWEDMVGVIIPTKLDRLLYGDNIADKSKDMTSILAHEEVELKIAEGRMSGRDFLQYFGTEVCRRFHNNVWANACIREISEDQPFLAIIDDLRFENELLVTKANAGVTYWLTRNSSTASTHSSEDSLDASSCDVVVDNEAMTIEESCLFVLKDMKERGILE